jgi:hypothetical protein
VRRLAAATGRRLDRSRHGRLGVAGLGLVRLLVVRRRGGSLQLGLGDRGGDRIDVRRLGRHAVLRQLVDVGAAGRRGLHARCVVLRVDLRDRLRGGPARCGASCGVAVDRWVADIAELLVVVFLVAIGVAGHGVLGGYSSDVAASTWPIDRYSPRAACMTVA